jgi:hypothetical protein
MLASNGCTVTMIDHLYAGEDLRNCDRGPPALFLHIAHCTLQVQELLLCEVLFSLYCRTSQAIAGCVQKRCDKFSYKDSPQSPGQHPPRSGSTGRPCRWGRHSGGRTPHQTCTAQQHTTRLLCSAPSCVRSALDAGRQNCPPWQPQQRTLPSVMRTTGRAVTPYLGRPGWVVLAELHCQRIVPALPVVRACQRFESGGRQAVHITPQWSLTAGPFQFDLTARHTQASCQLRHRQSFAQLSGALRSCARAACSPVGALLAWDEALPPHEVHRAAAKQLGTTQC